MSSIFIPFIMFVLFSNKKEQVQTSLETKPLMEIKTHELVSREIIPEDNQTDSVDEETTDLIIEDCNES